MIPPLNREEWEAQHGPLPAKGCHTFSNGTQWDYWADHNCFRCRYWDKDVAGKLCAFECASMIGMVPPEMMEDFGWTRNEKYPDSWNEPDECTHFKEHPEDDWGKDTPEPDSPDPAQLHVFADQRTAHDLILPLAPRSLPSKVAHAR